MPPAKKSSTSTRRRASSSPAPTSKITRKEVEQATARFEKALEDANHALQAIGKDLGKSARQAYKDLADSLKTLRQNARTTNRGFVKDLDKLVATVTAGKAPSRTAGKPASRGTARKPASRAAAKPASRTAAKKPASRTAAKPASRTAAKKPASRTAAKPASRTAAKKPTRSRRSS
jgi:hypothetical protein